jgi:hypothetical protein
VLVDLPPVYYNGYMNTLTTILQIIVVLGIYNVWLVRPDKATKYRGLHAQNMKSEFAAYGLPAWAMPVVGAIKLLSATALLFAFWIPELFLPASHVLFFMMIGAVAMHVKVRDTAIKYLPAIAMLVMCAGLAILSHI